MEEHIEFIRRREDSVIIGVGIRVTLLQTYAALRDG